MIPVIPIVEDEVPSEEKIFASFHSCCHCCEIIVNDVEDWFNTETSPIRLVIERTQGWLQVPSSNPVLIRRDNSSCPWAGSSPSTVVSWMNDVASNTVNETIIG